MVSLLRFFKITILNKTQIKRCASEMTPSVIQPLTRGAFIVLEGCDRCGKSTQCGLLSEFLQKEGVPVRRLCFPDRTTTIGKTINAFLQNKSELNDETIHLLFTTNRWEFRRQMEELLKSGTTLVVDRYSYSGVAYSVAKGLNFEWCMNPEKGLLQPDAVLYLQAPIEKLILRGNFGEERYEKEDFQRKVADAFERLEQQEKRYWHCFDASQTQESLQQQLREKTLQIISDVKHAELNVLT